MYDLNVIENYTITQYYSVYGVILMIIMNIMNQSWENKVRFQITNLNINWNRETNKFL